MSDWQPARNCTTEDDDDAEQQRDAESFLLAVARIDVHERVEKLGPARLSSAYVWRDVCPFLIAVPAQKIHYHKHERKAKSSK